MKIFQQHGMLSYTYLSTVLFIHMANVCRHFIVYAIQWFFKHLLCKLTITFLNSSLGLSSVNVEQTLLLTCGPKSLYYTY